MKCRFEKYRFVRYWFRFVSRPWFDTYIPVNILFICKMSSRRLQDIFSGTVFCVARRFEDILKTPWRCLTNTPCRQLEHILKISHQTSWKHLQDVFIEEVLRTSWKTKNCYTEDVLETLSRHFLKTSKCMLSGCGKKALFIKITKAYRYKERI